MAINYDIQSIHKRIYPGRENVLGLKIKQFTCLLGQRFSFKLPIYFPKSKMGANESESKIIRVGLTAKEIPGISIRIRRLGFVPVTHHTDEVADDVLDCVDHIPGLIEDPLFDEQDIITRTGEMACFLVTVAVEKDCSPISRVLKLKLFKKNGDQCTQTEEINIILNVLDRELERPRDFPVLQWFYNDAIADWYKLDLWNGNYWNRLKSYMDNLVEHGQNGVMVPLFTPPTDGVKRPTQLLKISSQGDEYSFDWSDVEKYLALAEAFGIQYFEWNHFFTQWGVEYAIRIYEGQGQDESKLLWAEETGATSPVYRDFLSQLLPEFHNFLTKNRILEKSFFHLSDEPNKEHLSNYKQARAMLKELAPWMKIMDAMSDVSFALEGLTDMPVPGSDHIMDFIDKGIDPRVYFCCAQRGRSINRFLDTPLIRQRMLGWLCYHFRCQSFLHWGYNYWYKHLTRQMLDPFTDTTADSWPKIPAGDPFIVYPGPNGPIDSIRWEIFAESMQDYALLQTLGVDPNDELFAEFNDFCDFPASDSWLLKTQDKLLKKFVKK